MQGSKFLKVMGILLIVFAGINIVLSIIAAIGVGALAVLGADAGKLWIAVILQILMAVFGLIAGISGVKNWQNPAVAGKCVVWGLVIAVLAIAQNIFNGVAMGTGINIVSLLLSLVVPVLYLIAALQLKKQD